MRLESSWDSKHPGHSRRISGSSRSPANRATVWVLPKRTAHPGSTAEAPATSLSIASMALTQGVCETRQYHD